MAPAVFHAPVLFSRIDEVLSTRTGLSTYRLLLLSRTTLFPAPTRSLSINGRVASQGQVFTVPTPLSPHHAEFLLHTIESFTDELFSFHRAFHTDEFVLLQRVCPRPQTSSQLDKLLSAPAKYFSRPGSFRIDERFPAQRAVFKSTHVFTTPSSSFCISEYCIIESIPSRRVSSNALGPIL